MRKGLLALIVAFAIVAIPGSAAHAGDEFEHGFKFELGAIAAHAVVGAGVGLVTGVTHGVHHHGHHRRHGHHRAHRPHRTKVVVYRPSPVPVYRVERRVVYRSPPPVHCY